jgi:hypothetical protein
VASLFRLRSPRRTTPRQVRDVKSRMDRA